MQLGVKCIGIFLLSLFILTIAVPSKVFANGQPQRIGIVLLHGKTGLPSNANIAEADESFKQAGYLVETPEMPWSKARYIDKSFPESLDEIDLAIVRLKAQGATKIVIAGHSTGGDAALAYAAYHGHITGLILPSPAHMPDASYFLNNFAGDVAKAKAMIDAGNGDQYADFKDINMGIPYT